RGSSERQRRAMAWYSWGEKGSQVTLSPRVSRKGNLASSHRVGMVDGYNKRPRERQLVVGRKGPGQGRILGSASKAATWPFSPAPGWVRLSRTAESPPPLGNG